MVPSTASIYAEKYDLSQSKNSYSMLQLKSYSLHLT